MCPHEKLDSYEGVPQSVCAMVYVWSGKAVGRMVVVVHLQDWTVSGQKEILLDLLLSVYM